MTEPMTPEQEKEYIKSNLHDQRWRLFNLYTIKGVDGKAIPFRPNWAQVDFSCSLHDFNVVLKARQLGFTTWILIYFLDCCLFHENHAAGVIAQDLNKAEDLFDNKVKFAYDNLPPWIRALPEMKLISDNAKELKFKNGSSLTVGTSLRGGTFQKLLVSEFGKISAEFPKKAKEIKTGAFNTVHIGQQIFVESTAEGQAGEFFDLVKLARKLDDAGKELSPLDPKFHFYSWQRNPNYVLGAGDALRTVITEEQHTYFAELKKEHGIELTLEQKAWYVKKSEVMQDDMMREYPSTPDEAFSASVSGAIYPKQMRTLRRAGMITRVPWEPKALVHTFWDFGNANYMAIWFFQQVGREWRMIRYYQHSGKDFAQYIEYMLEQGYIYGNHYVPHDGATTRMMETGNKTYKQVMEGLGLKNIKVVPVTKSKWKDIEFVCKPALLKCWIDEVNCADGIACLDNYKKVQNKDGIWLNEPKHDEYSDGADAFRTFAMGWKEPVKTEPVSFIIEGAQHAPCQP